MHKKLLTYIKPSRGILAFTIVLGLLGAIATIALMTLLSQIVNAVFLSHKGLAQVLLPLALLLGAIILRASLLWAREVTAQRAAIRVKTSLRERVFAYLLQLGPTFSKGERTGELTAVLNEGIERLDAYVSRYLPQLVLSVLVPVLIIIVILPVDWFSAVLLLFTGPVIPLLMALVGSNTQKRTQAQWATLSLMSAYFLDVMQGLTTLKLFGRSQAQQERIAHISNRFRDKTLQVLRYAFLSGAVLEFMTMSAIGVIATTLGIRLLNHSISFDKAFLILLLTPEFYRPLQELGVQRHAAMEGEASAKRIIEILETPLPTQDLRRGRFIAPTADVSALSPQSPATADLSAPSPKSPQSMETPIEPAIEEPIPPGPITIDITDLTYTYPNKETPALNHVTLSLPANTCTALVGRSGAGKSTLVNLLMRFMDATSGTICANGVPITDLSPDSWREYVALVPQRPYLFYGTVRENIRLACPDASEDEVMHAAELAGVTTFIDELPQGFDTQVGEQGTQLSAGQAQRVAIARAILKNAPILILDEPTSSLDPDSEAHIRQSLATLMRDRTVLVIAHRYNTIAQADRVIVLENGRIVESGTQQALTLSSGAYANLIGAVKTSTGTVTLQLRGGLTQVGSLKGLAVVVEAGAAGSGDGAPCGCLPSPSPSVLSLEKPTRVSMGRSGGWAGALSLSGLSSSTNSAGWKVAMKTFTRLLAFLSPFRWRIALAILLGSLMIASSITLFGMAAYLIAAAALVPLLVFLSIPIYVVQTMGILRATSRYVERLISHNTTFRLLANLRVWAYKRIEPQAPAHLLAHRSGDMLARLVADIEELQNFYLRVVSPIVVALVLSLFTFGVFSIFSTGMSWTALAFLVVAGLGVPFLAASLSRGLGKQQLRARAELNTQIVDGIQGIQDVLAFGRTHAQLESVLACDRTLGQVQRRMARITGLQTALNDLLMNTAMWVLIILAIPLVATKSINGVYLGAIGLLILASFEAVQPLASAFQGLGHSRAAAERVFAVTDAQPPVIESATPQPIPTNSDGYGLSFEHVHFTYSPGSNTKQEPEPYHSKGGGQWGSLDTYTGRFFERTFGESRGRGGWGWMRGPLRVPSVPLRLAGPFLQKPTRVSPLRVPSVPLHLSGPSPEKSPYVRSLGRPPIDAISPGKREVLSDISFDLRSGSRVAIVGPSGSGKSTLVRLAVRFWDPTSGTICLNGQDIRRYSLHDLRNLVGVVAQDTYIFNDTLRANLLLARPEASETEIEAAIEQAQLTDFVRQLPQGLKTRVGEQGLQLSGGERQRLAIARALLKNAPILILDEATANLDPLIERALLDTLNELTRGRTTLQITHRLLGMERMDEILVLYRGNIVERGTHDDLLAIDGLYRQLFDVQHGVLTFSTLAGEP